MGKFELVAKTFAGLEDVLAKELKSLGAEDVQVRKRAVSFQGNQELLYKTNVCSRIALRILKPIFRFTANNEDELYKNIYKFNWGAYLNNDKTFAIDNVVFSKIFTHSKYAGLKTKDAIADYFKDSTGKRPNVDVKNPDLLINLHIFENEVIISFDASGEALYKRGYRTETVEAPINEVLAAGMIAITGWSKDCDFIDPMCGSGTIPIEAALYAKNIAPGLNRSFGFEKWTDFDAELLQKVKKDAKDNETDFEHKIIAYDSHMQAVRYTEKNIENIGFSDVITVKRKAIERLTPVENKAMVIFNPPYGERLEKEEINYFYKGIGDSLKHNFQGCNAWIISSNMDAMRNLGLKSSSRKTLYNGSLECWFSKYEMY